MFREICPIFLIFQVFSSLSRISLPRLKRLFLLLPNSVSFSAVRGILEDCSDRTRRHGTLISKKPGKGEYAEALTGLMNTLEAI